jgi:carboxynorspermidine decarboxylase
MKSTPHSSTGSPALAKLMLADLSTPAFVYDEAQLISDASRARSALGSGDTRLLAAMKALAVPDALRLLAPRLDGLHASSLFEARLARDVLGKNGLIHVTSPGLRTEEAAELFEYADFFSFNSITQWDRLRSLSRGGLSPGLRVNPQLSIVDDPRYDPCRPQSKLGVPLTQLREILRLNPARLRGLEGLLVHSNCDATDLSPLLATVRALEQEIAPLLKQIAWLNLGGGYLFAEAEDLRPLSEAINLLRDRYRCSVMFEPGAALFRSAGYLVASVVDMFESDHEKVAVLDTTVNHLPEVFEYQYVHEVAGESEDGPHRYVVAGASCLAGDIFGAYSFDEPLEIGSRVIFVDAGAYSFVKANMFNGINLPAVYALTASGHLIQKREYTYKDFLTRCGERTK